jgi:GABA(A) receptor-associated protein
MEERPFLCYEEFRKFKEKYPNKIPVFVRRGEYCCDNVPELQKRKFIVPLNITAGDFIIILRNYMELPIDVPLFLFINDTLVNTRALISELYDLYKSLDGGLRVRYLSENTFGAIGI